MTTFKFIKHRHKNFSLNRLRTKTPTSSLQHLLRKQTQLDRVGSMIQKTELEHYTIRGLFTYRSKNTCIDNVVL